MNDIIIRAVKESDAQAILNIYSPYVQNTAITFEWEIPSLDEFTQRIRTISEKYPYLVAIYNDEIVGYAYANTFRTRAAYKWDVESSIYVKKDFHHKGIGKLLLQELEKKLKELNFLNIYAVITYTETEDEYLTHGSIFFHQKMGYIKVGQFNDCGYKFKRWYSVVIMEKFLNEHTESPEDTLKRKNDRLPGLH